MKILLFDENEYEAEKIVKDIDSIRGYNSTGEEIFSFTGVTDFTLFSLKDGVEWDLPDPKPYVPKVIDDLTTGGHKDTLSAEQGKIIKDYYDTQAKELAKIATNTLLGRVKIDDRTIKTNADGQVYVSGYEQAKLDIQSLFVGWANETKSAVTALAQKGVTLSQDATMKEVVAGIESIKMGNSNISYKTATSTAEKRDFALVINGTRQMNYIIVDFSDLTFSPKAIIAEDSSYSGKSAIVHILRGSSMVACTTYKAEQTDTGTADWFKLSDTNMPTNFITIPVSGATNWNVTIYG